MPLAAIPAVIGASLIGGGASVATSLINKKKGGGAGTAGSAGSPLDPSITALNTKLGNLADYQLQQGQQILPRALNALRGPEDFYRALLSGNRGAAMSLLGPQLNAIGEQGAAQQRTASELLPRGGGLTDRLGANSTATTGQINDALLSYRPAAAQSLAGIGGQYGSLGAGLLGQSGATLSSNLSSLLNQRGQDINAYLAKYQAQQENDRSLGRGIGDILSLLLSPGGILSKGKSSPVTPSWNPTHEGGH